MAKTKGLPKRDTFTTTQMFEAIIDCHDLSLDYEAAQRMQKESGDKRNIYKDKIVRQIQRYLSNNEIEPLGKTRNRNENYYSESVFNGLMNDPRIATYGRRLSAKSYNFRTNAKVIQEQQSEIDDKKRLYHNALDRLGIQNVRLPKGKVSSEEADAIMNSEANILAADMLKNDNERLYLRIDELKFLGLKGLHKRTDLSEDDKALLRRYEEHLRFYS